LEKAAPRPEGAQRAYQASHRSCVIYFEDNCYFYLREPIGLTPGDRIEDARRIVVLNRMAYCLANTLPISRA
jgi:hypothetical protein